MSYYSHTTIYVCMFVCMFVCVCVCVRNEDRISTVQKVWYLKMIMLFKYWFDQKIPNQQHSSSNSKLSAGSLTSEQKDDH